MCLSITLLPVPEPPTTTSDSPAWTSRSMASSTTFSPNDLLTPRSEILAAGGRRLRAAERQSSSSRRGRRALGHVGAHKSSLVRKKSEIRIAMLASTTERVVARPTPSAPPRA